MENMTTLDNRIAVLATMSSGKSTFINALLGENLLPSENQACTGKIFEISNSNKEKIEAFTEDNKIIKIFDKKDLKEKNRDGNVKRIKINTKFSKIKSKITIFDTPGVNSYSNYGDKEVTYNFLRDENIENIIYIINATQIGVTDDQKFLIDLRELYRNKNLNIIFLLNKFDLIDLELESGSNVIKNVENYLENIGFETPKIIPFSAQKAKILRLGKEKKLTSRKEKFEYSQYTKNCTEKKKIDRLIKKTKIEEIEEFLSQKMIKKQKKEVIEVKYNPYTYELEILKSSIPLNKESDILRKKEENNDKAFHIWCKKFIESIKETFNSKSFKIVFNGRREDFMDLKEQIDYLNQNEDWEVDYKLKEYKGNENIIADLDNYVKKISADAPEELKKEIKKHKAIEEFEKAKDNDVEISVIATMSSGKSTLLNAILGSNILPSKNEACTATICNIKDVKERDMFIARAETLDGKEIAPWGEAEAEKIKEFNQRGNEEGINIFVEGNIKGVKDGEMNLVLIDTPGPNNSQNMVHKEATYKFIKDTKNNPLVLYVMNITQQATNDDAKLLGEISEIIKNNGKQVEERFIFALNKIDCFDPEKESIDNLIDDCIKYLKGFGIENPKIFPVSAEFAKVIRLNEANEKMSRSQKGFLLKAESAFLPDEEDGYEGIDTIKYASISDAEKQKLYEEGKNDKLKAMLNYSGISAIELYIDKYVNKYAKTQKVKDSISTLKKVVDTANMKMEILSIKISKELEEKRSQIEIEMMKELNEKVKNSFTNIVKKFTEEELKSKAIEDLKRNTQKEIEKIKNDVNEEMKYLKQIISQQKEKYNQELNIVRGYKKELDDILQISKGKITNNYKKDKRFSRHSKKQYKGE